MIVVSDTTPLNYLIIIDRVDILRTLYNEVVIPPAVLNEMQAPGTPPSVIAWMRNRPKWITVERVAESTITDEEIEQGEAEAISLAEELHADLILLDDRRAREIAKTHNLRVVGTLGVLVEAADRGLIDLGAALAELKKTNFRFSQVVLNAALERIREPKT